LPVDFTLKDDHGCHSIIEGNSFLVWLAFLIVFIVFSSPETTSLGP